MRWKGRRKKEEEKEGKEEKERNRRKTKKQKKKREMKNVFGVQLRPEARAVTSYAMARKDKTRATNTDTGEARVGEVRPHPYQLGRKKQPQTGIDSF
jgi:hypothetical protein